MSTIQLLHHRNCAKDLPEELELSHRKNREQLVLKLSVFYIPFLSRLAFIQSEAAYVELGCSKKVKNISKHAAFKFCAELNFLPSLNHQKGQNMNQNLLSRL